MSVTTATLPPELSRHWVKRLARAMGVPNETARHWTFRRMPDARRREIALALVAECNRLEGVINNIREEWQGVADEPDDDTRRNDATKDAAAALARGTADRDGPLAGGARRPRMTI